MKCSLPAFVFFIASMAASTLSRAQGTASDSMFYHEAIQHAVAVYHANAHDQLEIFHGRNYAPYHFTFQGGSPFFGSGQFVEGSLVYEGILYRDQPMLFDDLSTILILRAPNGWIELSNEKISHFTIDGHQFLRLEADSAKIITTGFYELIYDGRLQVMKQLKKKIREDLSSGKTVERFIEDSKAYFIKAGDTYYPVKRKADVYRYFPGHKAQLQQLIKKNQLNFRRNLEEAVIETAGFLSNQAS